MRMPGDSPDPLYVAARSILLDALQALEEHLDALVVVGAQAIYLRTGEGDIAVAPYTTDADLAIDADRLQPEPRIEVALAEAGFTREGLDVGIWTKKLFVGGSQRVVPVDFLVPESRGGAGRRSARIPPHETGVARKVVGLEGALVDNDPMSINALETGDTRSFNIRVAGPAALLVAKAHKLSERRDHPGRQSDKDALDVLRLLRAVHPDALNEGFQRLLRAPVAADVAGTALEELEDLFRSPSALGSRMAARAAAGFEPEDVIAASAAALAGDLIRAIRSQRDPTP